MRNSANIRGGLQHIYDVKNMNTNDSLAEHFLKHCCSRLEVLSSWADDCLGRLTYDQLWWRAGEAQNAIGNLVLHLCGNVSQRVTSALSSNTPDTRDRDREFDSRSCATPAELRELLKAAVAEATATLRCFPPDRLLERAQIPYYERSVMQNIFAVVEHFAQHTGQIMFATKQLTHQELDYYPHLKRKKASRSQRNRPGRY